MKEVYQEGNKNYAITDFAFNKNIEMLNKCVNVIKESKVKTSSNLFYKMYWKKLNKRVKISELIH